MPVYKIQSPVLLFNYSFYGQRLLFQQGISNPRNQLGKNGLTVHSWFGSLFYKTITLQATLIDKEGRHEHQQFIINRNSLIKYLGASAKSENSDEELIAALCAQLFDSPLNQPNELDKQKQSEAGEHLRHAGEYNQSSVQYSLWGNLKAALFSWLYQKTIESLSYFKARFLLISTEQDLFEAGELLAKKRFHEAYASVPAYKQHIMRFNGHSVAHRTFYDIPMTDKENYIKFQQYDSDTHFHGQYPIYGKVDTSTGTTGKSTAWVRSEKEVNAVKKTLELAVDAQFGTHRVSYINAFALGPWATGLTAYEFMRSTGTVFATGADKEKILDELVRIYNYEQHQLDLEVRALAIDDVNKRVIANLVKNTLSTALKNKNTDLLMLLEAQIKFLESDVQSLVHEYKEQIFGITQKLYQEKKQILITGYPPFLKDLALYIKAKGYNFSDFSAVGIVGGQAISEAMRDLLIKDGFNGIYSSYGASDLDVNLGSETDDELVIRKAIEQNPGLARELYGVNKGLPMVFHYDPMNYHVECDNNEKNKDSLIFTCTRNDRSSPRVRYNLGDKGRVYASSDVYALLAKYGVFHQPRSHLPLMFVWGRDSTVVFHGANLAFTELERAITDIDSAGQILKKAFYSYYDKEGNEHLEFWFELNEDVALFDEKSMSGYAQQLISKSGLSATVRD